eukprot:6484675-Amphidinium_carterae.2
MSDWSRGNAWDPSARPWEHPKYKRRRDDREGEVENTENNKDNDGDDIADACLSCTFWDEAQEAMGDTAEEMTRDEAESALLEFLVGLHERKGLAATQLGTIAYWAEKAGLASFAPYATKPTSSTGNFQKKIDKASGFVERRDQLYDFDVVAFAKSEGVRRKQKLYGMELADILETDLTRARLATDHAVRGAIVSANLSHQYWEHPLHQTAGPPIIPIALFMDGLVYGRSRNMLVFQVVNLVTQQRYLLTAVRKDWGCTCGCGSWCTLACIYNWIYYTFKCSESGVYARLRHDGTPFSDARRQDRAGSAMRVRAFLHQVRVDWSEWAHSLGVPNWRSTENPCPLCTTTRPNMFANMRNCGPSSVPFKLKNVDSYRRDCADCCVWVEQMSGRHFANLKKLLAPDRRRGLFRGGLTMTQAYPPLSLLKGDRFEPTPQCLDWQDFMDAETPPTYAICFWRVKDTSSAKHYCQLNDLAPDGLHQLVHIDSMHTLCLGVFLHFCASAVLHILSHNTFEASLYSKAQDDRQHGQALVLNAEISRFVRRYKKDTGKTLTGVPAIHPEKLGSKAQPTLHLKASQTVTLMRYLADALPDMMSLPEQTKWCAAAEHLVKFWEGMIHNPMELNAAHLEDYQIFLLPIQAKTKIYNKHVS